MNNCNEKTSECKPLYCCKEIWRRSEISLKKSGKATLPKKKPNVFGGSISNMQSIPSRNMMWSKKSLCKILDFNYQKSFAYVVCGKCVVEKIDYAFTSKGSLAF